MLSQEEKARYVKHLVLDKIGEEGQERIKNSKVLVVGAGGLGSPCLLYLTAAGVGKIGLIDFDQVDISNLQRQILYKEKDIGKNKVLVAKEELVLLNSEVIIEAYHERLAKNNAEEIISHYDVVLDAVDNRKTRYLIHEVCKKQGKIVIEGAVSRFGGLFYVTIPNKSIPYNEIFPIDEELCSIDGSIGIVGAVAGIIGSIMSLETIKILSGIKSEYTNKILLFDGEKIEFRTVGISDVAH